MIITLKKDDNSTWRYFWSANGAKFYVVAYSALRYPPTDDSRALMNVLIAGCPARVHAEYSKAERTLTLKPSEGVKTFV